MASAVFPVRDLVTTESGLMTRAWVDWLASLQQTVDTAPVRLQSVELTSQTASVGATDISLGTITGGLYRLTYYARITTAAVTSSSLTVTLGWTDSGVSCSLAGAALTGNTTATVQTGTALVRADHASPLTYTTTYASNGAGEMVYSLDVIVEKVLV